MDTHDFLCISFHFYCCLYSYAYDGNTIKFCTTLHLVTLHSFKLAVIEVDTSWKSYFFFPESQFVNFSLGRVHTRELWKIRSEEFICEPGSTHQLCSFQEDLVFPWLLLPGLILFPALSSGGGDFNIIYLFPYTVKFRMFSMTCYF